MTTATHDDFLAHFLDHQADLRAFIGAVVPDPHRRDDLFQETALTLWQRIDAYDPSRPFGAWARGVAARKILQRRERDAKFPLAFDPEALTALVAAFDRTDDDAEPRRLALRECLRLLPDDGRALLALRYEAGLAGDALAARLATTVEAVYQKLSRLRARLEECVNRRLGTEGDR